MCRNIVPLNNLEPAATDEECQEAALQFVRKISGTTAPSRANREVFDRAVAEIAVATRRLLDDLVTSAPPKNREEQAAKRRARSAERYEAIRVFRRRSGRRARADALRAGGGALCQNRRTPLDFPCGPVMKAPSSHRRIPPAGNLPKESCTWLRSPLASSSSTTTTTSPCSSRPSWNGVQAASSISRTTAGPALEKAAAVKPDVVVTDIEMPGLSGLELLAELRRLMPTVPVVVMTAHVSVEYAVSALRAQADEFLTKPLDNARLVESVTRLVEESRRRKAEAKTGEVVLAIGAHPDDVEIGVGGILAAHAAAGDQITILTLSRGARGGDADSRQHESLAAAEQVGARLFVKTSSTPRSRAEDRPSASSRRSCRRSSRPSSTRTRTTTATRITAR
ncbi:DUF2277 family protein [Microbacterium sp. NRRL B-14842]|uniref:DUF2277 family protein n=1 Tax=Microbacterium sp. NRRL B-14842 TaxID=3162881 RepID=UPI003D275D77